MHGQLLKSYLSKGGTVKEVVIKQGGKEIAVDSIKLDGQLVIIELEGKVTKAKAVKKDVED